MSTFAQKNLSQTEVSEMKALINKHAPFMNELIAHLTLSSCSTTCPEPWKKLLRSLSASSPVCALIHPNERELHDILTDIANNKKRIPDLDTSSLCCLQQQFPTLFNLILAMKSSGECNTLQHILSFLVPGLLKKANSPFGYQLSEVPETEDSTFGTPSDEIAFFPQLPIVRNRGSYAADKRSIKKVCTKLRSGHPTLLPGVFTLFCEHGMYFLCMDNQYCLLLVSVPCTT